MRLEEAKESNFRVVVRIRPLNDKEESRGSQHILQPLDENVLVFDPKKDNAPDFRRSAAGHLRRNPRVLQRRARDIQFAFDRVFDETARQEEVFEHTTRPILDGVLDGYNATVFCYGATGAGKTHTMLGHDGNPGVICLTVDELYRRIDSRSTDMRCELAVSYLEVYNEQIRDLLSPSSGQLQIREDASKGVVIPKLSLHKPKTAHELLEMLHRGNANRTQHPTDANATSSRSHAVFTVYVHQKPTGSGIKADVSVAKLCLIDLAGSERAAATTNRHARMREGANINRSLLALGNCINALAEGKKKSQHIPYRNSKLTRILKDSLGGNCRTVMIANCSPSCASYEDTYNTLRYANRAKNIKTSIRKNVVSVDFHVTRYKKIVESLRQEVSELKAQLEAKSYSKTKGEAFRADVLESQQQSLASTFSDRSVAIKSLVQAEASLRLAEADARRNRIANKRLSWLRSHGYTKLDYRKEKLEQDEKACVSLRANAMSQMQNFRSSLTSCNSETEQWQTQVDRMKLSEAEKARLKMELRWRAADSENQGNKLRAEALQSDLARETKQQKQQSRVISVLMKAVQRMGTKMDEAGLLDQQTSSMMDEALSLAAAGKEVNWADRLSLESQQRLEMATPPRMHSPKPNTSAIRVGQPTSILNSTRSYSEVAKSALRRAGQAVTVPTTPKAAAVTPFSGSLGSARRRRPETSAQDVSTPQKNEDSSKDSESTFATPSGTGSKAPTSSARRRQRRRRRQAAKGTPHRKALASQLDECENLPTTNNDEGNTQQDLNGTFTLEDGPTKTSDLPAPEDSKSVPVQPSIFQRKASKRGSRKQTSQPSQTDPSTSGNAYLRKASVRGFDKVSLRKENPLQDRKNTMTGTSGNAVPRYMKSTAATRQRTASMSRSRSQSFVSQSNKFR